MEKNIHHDLEAIKMVSIHNAKEHECNYTVFQHNGDTYESVTDSYWAKERPLAKILFRTDDLDEEGNPQNEFIQTCVEGVWTIGKVVETIEVPSDILKEEIQEFKDLAPIMTKPNGIDKLKQAEVVFVECSDQEQGEWQRLETTPFSSPRIMSINCDTRDFHCGWTTEERENPPDLYKLTKNQQVIDRFFFTIGEVKEILLELREKTGGVDKDWRFLSFIDGNKTLGGSWQFKYLRFYKTKWGWYCQPRSEMKIIKKKWLKLPINKQLE